MSSVPSIRAAGSPRRRLYWIGSLLAAAIVFAGFARTYYLKIAFDQAPPTPGIRILRHCFSHLRSGTVFGKFMASWAARAGNPRSPASSFPAGKEALR